MRFLRVLAALIGLGVIVGVVGPPSASAETAPTSDDVVISSSRVTVRLDPSFPRVRSYAADGAVLGGTDGRAGRIMINGSTYAPSVTRESARPDRVEYTVHVDPVGVRFTARFTITGNVLDLALVDITESGSTKVRTIGIPGQSLVSVDADQPGARLSSAPLPLDGSYNDHKLTDVYASVTDLPVDSSPKATTVALVNTDRLAAGVWSNAIGDKEVLNTQTTSVDGVKQTGLWSAAWTYRGLDGEVAVHPAAKVVISPDANDDGRVDWQDGAIAYRAATPKPKGADRVRKNVVSDIQWNIANQVENPFVDSLNDIKRTYLYTDGLGQSIELKGYQDQGHDSGHPDYAGHYNELAGGLADLKHLVAKAKEFNARIGVHINAAEQHPDADHFRWDNAATPLQQIWCGRDCTYRIDYNHDTQQHLFQKRIAALKDDVPDLSWVYVDAYFGHGWPAHTVASTINGLGWDLYTEFEGYLWPSAVWYHRSAEFENVGINSNIIRFIDNANRDAWVRKNALLMGAANEHGVGGWHGGHDWTDFLEETFTQNLPTKYLQSFDVMRMTDDRVDLTGATSVTRGPEGRRQIRHDGRLVMDGSKIFLPWNPTTEEKIYHWNPDGGTTKWQVPAAWAGQSQAKLYRLTDRGRVQVGTLPITNGTVAVPAKARTPYVLVPVNAPTRPQATAQSVGFGEGGRVVNNQFSAGLHGWDKAGAVTSATDARGWNHASIGGKGGEVSQEVSGLVPGRTYLASAWVGTTGDRRASLRIDGFGDQAAEKTIQGPPPVNGDEVSSFQGQHVQRLTVPFTVPQGRSSAVLHLVGARDTDAAAVTFTDVRVMPHTATSNPGNHAFFEDFEHVGPGWGPFIPTAKSIARTHPSQNHEGYTRDTINGKYSLKQRPAGPGLTYRTWEGTLRLESDRMYRVTASYQSDSPGAYAFEARTDNPDGVALRVPLARTTTRSLDSAPPATDPRPAGWTDSLPPQYPAPHRTFAQTFSTGTGCGDYFLAMNSLTGVGDVVIDDLAVDDLGPAPAGTTCPGQAVGQLELSRYAAEAGVTSPLKATFTNSTSQAIGPVEMKLSAPDGWTVSTTDPKAVTQVAPRSTVSVTYQVTPPADLQPGNYLLEASADYTFRGTENTAGATQQVGVDYCGADLSKCSLRLDAGSTTSPVADGYQRLSPESAWDASRGFGWVGTAPDSRDRGSGEDALRRDFTGGTSPATLRITVPAGRQEVHVLVGDGDYSTPPTIVTVDGTEVARNATLPAHEYRWLTFAVDGGTAGREVDLALSSTPGSFWRINALTVSPQ
ncbi:endo-alpha-N-acetylgalactosaminidase family protein [Streptomyces sp. NPDC005151]